MTRGRVLLAAAVVVVLAAGTVTAVALRSGAGASAGPQVTAAASPGLHGTRVLSPTYRVTPSGPLTHPRTLTLRLQRAAPAGWAVVVATAEAAGGPWAYLPATLSQDRRSVTVTITHHSLFTVIGFDLSALVRAFKSAFLDGLDGGATTTVDPPACPGASAAASGYQVTSSSGPAVYWCLGEDSGGQRVLRVVNHRRYPMELQHPGLSVAERPSIDYSQLSSLSHLLSGSESVLAPGNQIGYSVSVPAGGEAGVRTAIDGFGQGLYALQTGISALLEILTRFGVGGASTPVTVLNAALGDVACADALASGNAGSMFSSCFSPKDLIDDFGTTGALLAPIAAAGAVAAFFESEYQGLHDILTSNDQYTILISRGAHRFDLESVDWQDATIPGQLCQVPGTITLHDGTAVIPHSGLGPLDVYAGLTGPGVTSSVVYGQLPGSRVQAAALQVWCDNQGGTADGQLAEGYMVFDGANGKLTPLGTLTPQYSPSSQPHIPYLTSLTFGPSSVTTQQVFYTPTDGTCCPSGKASTAWTWSGTAFTPGSTHVSSH